MGEVSLAIDDGVATLTLHNPEARNAVSEDMARQLINLCDSIDDDPSIGAAIIRGEGGVFCSGADTRVLLSAEHAAQTPSPTIRSIYEAIFRLGSLEMPVVAAVRGAAVGAGLDLAMAADVRVVAQDARLIAGFQRLRIHPGGGFFALAGRLAGWQASAAMGVFGEEVSGERAVTLGLAWRAIESELVDDAARTMALRVAMDPDLSRVAIRSMRLELGPPAISWRAAIELERGAQTWSRQRLKDLSDS
jgi:enoyl-CoA hydratase